MQIATNEHPQHTGIPLLNLGFRPFFLGAGLFGAFTLIVWLYSYSSGVSLFPAMLPASLWHAHEMLFGYSTAVIAGFLLTASKNWTGRQTLHQLPLGLLCVCWALPRLFLVTNAVPLGLIAVFDIGFNIWLFVAISQPVLASGSKKQYPILGKIVFLSICNGLFYAQALGLTENTAITALYLALFVIVGLILMMSRRLLPFFIERGAGTPVTLKNSKALDLASLFIFLAFLITEVFTRQMLLSAIFSGLLAITLAIRALWWHRPGIWQRPLLWSFYLAYCTLICGFLAYALIPIGWITPMLALHTLTIGGIGLVTLAMMARVSLGHTGRDIHKPPRVISVAFIALFLAVLVRVAGGILLPQYYVITVLISGGLWILAMLIFALRYLPILGQKRIDNTYG